MIRVLTPETIAKLAAGEIIHSFAQALKELIENAVDAGAQSIQISIGQKQIVICNDNSSISRENHALLCARFCTSKIASFEDLQAVQTHGFRGEALSALSQVGVVVCTSGGFRSAHRDGAMAQIEPAAEDGTTTFSIDFHELECEKNVMRTLEALCCINNTVGFNIQHGDLTTVIPARASLHEAVNSYLQGTAEVLQLHTAEYALELYFCPSGKPPMCVINNKYLPLQPLCQKVQKLVQGTEKSSKQISACIFAKISPGLLDVNCHPQKLRLHIFNESAILEALEKAILQHIRQKAAKLAQILPVKQQKESYQTSPLRLLRQTNNEETISSQMLERVLAPVQFIDAHSRFAFSQNLEYQPLDDIQVFGVFHGDIVLFQRDFQICQFRFQNAWKVLQNNMAQFVSTGLSAVNPVFKCQGAMDSDSVPMRDSLVVSPLALFKSAKLVNVYQREKRKLVPRMTLLNLYKEDPQMWFSLFADCLFQHIKKDENLLFEVLRDCDVADSELIIGQNEILKMFNRL